MTTGSKEKRMKILALAAALSASIALAAPSPQTPESLLAAGKTAFNQNDGPRAVDLLEKAAALRPQSAEIYFWLSKAHAAVGETASGFKQLSMARKVIADLERTVELDPKHIQARIELAEYYSMAPGFLGGGEDKAREQAAAAKRLNSLDGHRAFAVMYVVQKKMDLARNEMVQAVREEPQSARAHAYLGRHFAAYDKNYRGAIDELEKAIQLDAAYMPAWYRLGEASALSGTNLARGEEALKKYLAYEPKEDEPPLYRAHYCLGQIYEKAGKKAEARQSYAQAVRMRPRTKTYEEALKRVS
jgi:tetratricopeptide (TPR) repeat protein